MSLTKTEHGTSLISRLFPGHLLSTAVSQVGASGKNLPANTGDEREEGLVHGSGRPPGGGRGNSLQSSGLGNPMDTGAWWAIVHRVAKSWTQLK